jgi:hypothetical protein
MLHTKRVIFMILPLLFVPLVYGMSSTPNVCALPRDPNSYGGSCGAVTTNPRTGVPQQTCCWGVMERGPYPKIGTTEVRCCQTCTTFGSGSGSQTTLDLILLERERFLSSIGNAILKGFIVLDFIYAVV